MKADGGGVGVTRMPAWLKGGLPEAGPLGRVRAHVAGFGLNAVCFEANCPNKRHCFQSGAVTFLILGRNCTRNCGFCNVTSAPPLPVDPDEPRRLACAVEGLGLSYVVITSVTRDDLDDGGSGQFEACLGELRRLERAPAVEVLTPDFGGDLEAAERVAAAGPEVYSHNLETVERLYPLVRAGAGYLRSLGILEHVRRRSGAPMVKSGLMLGIGETVEEVKTAMRHLAGAGCDIITLGQYLRPSKSHLPVAAYLEPGTFETLAEFARDLDLVPVCGPMVRSSFMAKAAFEQAVLRRQTCA